ncbi:MAG: hypothetical protein QOD06_2664, partial [Candidatus Binatota bacterium]|nr:hypothetical protein [Candidatus Binatota bacterium]
MRVALCFAAWVAAALASSAAAATPPPRIRHVIIERQELFAPDERLRVPGLPDLTFVFDVANWIHIQTKEQVIRREILLDDGDLAEPELLEESERNLRDLPFVRRVRLFTRPTEAPGWVDLIVQTQDTWTTEPRASFSSGGGSSKTEIGIVEKNLLGYGKTVAVRYRDEIDRTSRQLLYDDPLVLGTRFRLRGELADASDGRTRLGLFEYPFFAFETPWAGGVGGGDIEER